MTPTQKATTLLTTFMVVTLYGAIAAAETATTGDNRFTVAGQIALAEGLGLGIAAFGGALGQGKAVSAALEGIARNPSASGKIFTPMILGLALMESLVIYSLLIAFFLNGHLGDLVATMIP